MARMHLLTARTIEKMRDGECRFDGAGLWVEKTDGIWRYWFRYQRAGHRTQLSCGTSLRGASLALARDLAQGHREQLLRGLDPREEKQKAKAARRIARERQKSFRDAAKACHAALKAGWRNDKYRQQWLDRLERHAFPTLGALPVAQIDTALVLKVIEPLWVDRNFTGRLVRQQIEGILDFSKTRGWRSGENPARLKGHLANLLPKRGRALSVEHHAAMHFDEVPAFVAKLQQEEGTGARALEFTVLCATRTGETVGARRAEFNLGKAEWLIPGERTKTGKPHRVPLSPRAQEIVREMLAAHDADAKPDDFVFEGRRRRTPLSNMAMLMLMRRLDRAETVHGFRSSFKDFCSERTAFSNEVSEMALGHTIGSDVEASYRRGDLFAKRTKLMAAWASYCTTPPAERGSVVPMRKAE